MSDLLVDSRLYQVSDAMLVGSGGEGDVYRLTEQLAAKVYHQVDENRERKVLALCNSYSNHSAAFGTAAFAFPQHPAYRKEKAAAALVGFSMSFFGGLSPLYDVGYSLSDGRFAGKVDEDQALELVYKLFELAGSLHSARIILGDISPDNILYNSQTNTLVFVDLDTAQLGDFECRAFRSEYLDPTIEKSGRTLKGAYRYSIDSDIFALACVAYEFLVGAHPFFIYTEPPGDAAANKRDSVSMLAYLIHGDRGLQERGRKNREKPANTAIRKRLEALRTKDDRLFSFWVSVFVEGLRDSLLSKLPVNDSRNPAYVVFLADFVDPIRSQLRTVVGKIKERVHAAAVRPTLPAAPPPVVAEPLALSDVDEATIQRSKADPHELRDFLTSYGISYAQLTRGL